ncbi:uncharacterized protein LOC105794619 [Gossypium raimondii]|uniref:uncharacterized protein LOC105794619 n=1 Tax=Gossypium raimondii TaxID=29730 RepID=UPI00227B615D|nr:uncharacterized protein LOC105794619 [Gossypium raimondii]
MSSLVAKIYSGFTFVATCAVNTKVDMRFNVKQAYWLSDRIRVRIMQMVRKENLGDRITAFHPACFTIWEEKWWSTAARR